MVPDCDWDPSLQFRIVPLIIISLSFKFHKNESCLKVSKILLKNDDTLLEFKRTWRFLTGAGVLNHVLYGFFLMTISLSFKFHKNPSCLKVSRTLLKNDDTLMEFKRMWRFLTLAWILDHLLEFRRTWSFLTGAGVLDHVFMHYFDDNKLMFKFS